VSFQYQKGHPGVHHKLGKQYDWEKCAQGAVGAWAGGVWEEHFMYGNR
jgi:hypothetical protein